MQRHHKGFHESLTSLDEATKLSYETTQHYLNFQAQLIQNLKLRSLSNQERLQSEITLVLLHHLMHPDALRNYPLIVYRLTT
jgi:hypothetical protein